MISTSGTLKQFIIFCFVNEIVNININTSQLNIDYCGRVLNEKLTRKFFNIILYGFASK